jgi:putative nucleotidyltransferase with HDIG domain
MKIDHSFLKSKVARRIFVVFILCALVPIFAVSGISYFQVSKQLKTQGMEQLYNSAKIHGLSIYERFLLLESHLNNLSSAIQATGPKMDPVNAEKVIGKKSIQRFTALALIKNAQKIIPLYGRLNHFSLDLLTKPVTDKISIVFQDNPDLPSDIYMVLRLNPADPLSDYLVGQVEVASLWGIGHENSLPHMTTLCIITQFRKILISSFSVPDTLLSKIMIKNNGKKSNYLQYEDKGQGYYVTYRQVFLQSGFDSPNISVVLRRSERNIMSPVADFKKIFPLVVLLSIWIILYLCLSFIRKSLTPLEQLKKGTLRLAKRDFKTQVVVKSNDEFEDLADSFNMMSGQLGRHFEAVTTRSKIDRAVLSSLSVKKIVNTALKRIYLFFGCDAISINLAMDKKPTTYHAFVLSDINVRKTVEEFFNISQEDRNILAATKTHLTLDLTEEHPSFLSPAAMENMSSFLVLPLFFEGDLKATIALGFKERKNFSKEDLDQARQIADQVSVALSNSSLVSALKKLNLGTLEALARTVDAKSTWTAGHSERVTLLSVKIAQVMGWDEKQLESMKRAAYLHDIGKIGIPLSILDKPDRLSEAEYEMIKDHPEIGARILEPIEAYADVIPMVLQHHEKYNGKGYPNGIAGEEISMGARIMAVADVYDAVVSDRPYRQGWIEEKAIKMIKEEAGEHFDPNVVDAFLTAISE